MSADVKGPIDMKKTSLRKFYIRKTKAPWDPYPWKVYSPFFGAKHGFKYWYQARDCVNYLVRKYNG